MDQQQITQLGDELYEALTAGKTVSPLTSRGFDITIEIGKDVKWEPKGFAELVAKIEATGGDPREYVEIKYSVSEAKFKAWPQTLRAPFEALRTVTPKAPKFVLRRAGEGQ